MDSPSDIRPVRRGMRPGRIALLYLVMSLVLLVWVPVLATTLPDHAVSHNYRLAWVGFDILLLLTLARTAWLAWRQSPFVVNVASASAALLVVDAWFDVTTATRHGFLQACVMALVFELPLAVLSLVIAGRAQERIARTGALAPPSRVLRVLARERDGVVPVAVDEASAVAGSPGGAASSPERRT